MVDITNQQIEEFVDQQFDEVADQVFDDALESQIKDGTDPADFKVSTENLKAASLTAAEALPANLRLSLFAGSSNWAAAASEGGGAKTVNTAKVVSEADDEKRKSAADAIRSYVCSEVRSWFEGNLEKVKGWVEELGIKGTLKKMASMAKQLAVAAVTAIAGVVGSMFLAYLLIAVAIAAVGAAIYFLVKNGLPNYCAA